MTTDTTTPLARLTLPPDEEALPRYLGVAAKENYHQALGFCDRPIAEMKGDR